MSRNTVCKYVRSLEKKGLIRTERTTVTLKTDANGTAHCSTRCCRWSRRWRSTTSTNCTSRRWPPSVTAPSRSWRHRLKNHRVRPCEPLCGLLRGGAASLPRRKIPSRFWADFRGLSRLCGGQNRAPAEAQRSGFGGKRSHSGMIEFSPLSAETRDMELASTRSRIKGWRRNRRSAQSLLPAVRAVCRGSNAGGCGAFFGKFQNGWRLCSRKRRCFNKNKRALRQIGENDEQK